MLFESGGGLDAAQWDDVLPAIYKATGATLITYDRQGFGTSGIDTAAYTILNEIKGLESGLIQLRYANRPMILVCHSLGFFYSRLYASRHPKLIKGIIMLDPRIPSNTDMAFATKIFEQVKRAYDVDKLNGADLALFYVFKTMNKNEDIVQKSLLPVTIPMLDIMAGFGPYDNKIDNVRFKSAQKLFIRQRPNCKFVYAKGSSHNIPKSRPLLVSRQIIHFYKLYH